MTRTLRTRRSSSDAWTKLFATIVVTLAHALIGALPIMWLTAFLVDQGWTAITPLGYWASYFAALMLSWIIDGASTVRRAMEGE